MIYIFTIAIYKRRESRVQLPFLPLQSLGPGWGEDDVPGWGEEGAAVGTGEGVAFGWGWVTAAGSGWGEVAAVGSVPLGEVNGITWGVGGLRGSAPSCCSRRCRKRLCLAENDLKHTLQVGTAERRQLFSIEAKLIIYSMSMYLFLLMLTSGANRWLFSSGRRHGRCHTSLLLWRSIVVVYMDKQSYWLWLILSVSCTDYMQWLNIITQWLYIWLTGMSLHVTF